MITKKYIDALIASKFDLLKSNELFKNNIANVQKEIRAELESLAGLAAPEVCLDRCNFFNYLVAQGHHLCLEVFQKSKLKNLANLNVSLRYHI